MGVAPQALNELSLVNNKVHCLCLAHFFLSWYFAVTETIRLIRDGRMEVGKEGDSVHTPILSPPE